MAIGSDYASPLDAVEAFDCEDEALDYIKQENNGILSEECIGSEDDPSAIEWQLFNPQALHELGYDSEYFLCAVKCDSFNGRYCSVELKAFIKLAFGKQTVFADIQFVKPAQVTQWINKDAHVMFEDDHWKIMLPKREIAF